MSTELTRPWFDHYDAFVPHTASVWNKPLYAMLDEAAEKYPNRYALIFQNTRITYKKLRERAELFAGALRRMGVRSGQRVAIMLPNLPQTMIAFWVVITAGAVVVMTNPLYMEKEIVANMQDSGAEHMILLDMLWPRIDALRDRLPLRNFIVTSAADSLSFPLNWLYKLKKRRSNKAPIPYDNKNVFAWQSFCKGARRYAAPIADPQRDPIMLQYTGGTTGLPKGVVLTHANLGTNCRQVLNIINVRPETHHTFISLLPFFHVYGLTTGLIIPMALASTTLPLPRYVPQDVLRLIDKR